MRRNGPIWQHLVDYFRIVMKTMTYAGLMVGTLDILAAFLHFYLKTHGSPVLVLHYIASGMFGDDAYDGGIVMAVWGLLFHFVIAYVFTALFFVTYRLSPFFRRMGLVSGILYGVFMWIVMQFIVIPLSKISSVSPLDFADVVIAITILIVCIGIPLYYLARQTYKLDRKP